VQSNCESIPTPGYNLQAGDGEFDFQSLVVTKSIFRCCTKTFNIIIFPNCC